MASSQVALKRTEHEAGHVTLLEIRTDGTPEWQVNYRDGGLSGRYWYGEYDRALAEYRRRVRTCGSLA